MTASLPPIPSAQPTAAPQPVAASSDPGSGVPFSQVLSGEMAQQRRAENADGKTAESASVQTDAADGGDALPGGKPAQRASDDAQTTDPRQADTPQTLPDTMLALAMQPDVQRPAGLPPVADPSAEAATAPEIAPDTRAAPRTVAVADPAAARTGRTAGTAANLAAASAAAASAADTPRAPAGDTQAGSDAAVPHEKTAIADMLAKHMPETARAAERLPDFAATLSAAQSAQPIAPSAAAAAGLHARDHLQQPVGSQAWNQALGDRIVWMATGGQQSATLTLNPPDLGPLQVVLNVSNDQATANFIAAQPEVRQALETALPRLRDMMQDAGIQLGQATVSADTPRQQDMRDSGPQRTAGGFPDGSGSDRGTEAVLPPPAARAGRGLVDMFA